MGASCDLSLSNPPNESILVLKSLKYIKNMPRINGNTLLNPNPQLFRLPEKFWLYNVMHSFTLAISMAPLQAHYYSEALLTTARILYRSFTPKRMCMTVSAAQFKFLT